MLPILKNYDLTEDVKSELDNIIAPFLSASHNLPRLQVKLDDLTQEVNPDHPLANKVIEGLKGFEISRLALSANSQRSLNSVVRSYVTFCRSIDAKALPIEPIMTLAYYIHLDNEKKSLNTIKAHMAQISKLASITNSVNPNTHISVIGFKKTIEERMGLEADPRLTPQQAPGLFAKDLECIIKAWHRSKKLIHIRDLAILIIAYASSLREEEICNFRISDISISEDRCLKLTRRLAKNRKRDLDDKVINQQLSTYVIKYLEMRKDAGPDAYFLTGVSPRGVSFIEDNERMTSKGVCGIFERAYFAINPTVKKLKESLIAHHGRDKVTKRMFDPDRRIFTGHSARIGSVVDAFEAKEELGITDADLMKMGDWSRIDMVLHYTRHLRHETTANFKNQSLVSTNFD
ncbi:tyrosine-type recombinase/integrase [Vibrio owensii]|uniref:tyrosine-type recombinase/integrase n=1 Tax=Vibrio owensii TaxID=696485 RepID=UPI0018F2373C|nr:hypothetical protein [Vibrio owensii]